MPASKCKRASGINKLQPIDLACGLLKASEPPFNRLAFCLLPLAVPNVQKSSYQPSRYAWPCGYADGMCQLAGIPYGHVVSTDTLLLRALPIRKLTWQDRFLHLRRQPTGMHWLAASSRTVLSVCCKRRW